MPSTAVSAVTFLARRYLRAKRSFVSIITIISVLGVAMGVLMMIVVNSVMKGFEREFRQALIGYQPHMLIKPADGKTASASETAAILQKIRTRPETAHTSTYAGGYVYLEKNGQQSVAELFGLPAESAGYYMQKIKKHLLDGTTDLADGGIIAPDECAARLDARSGDTISIYPSSSVTQAVRSFRTATDIEDEEKRKAAYKQIKLHPREIRLLGYTRTESAGFYAYTTLPTAQNIFGMQQSVSGILVEVHDPNAIKATHSALQAAGIIPPGWKATLWTDVGDARLAAMSNERFMMFFIIGIIGLVAAFSVMNTTITVTTQKRREIGVLTALGARQGQIIRIFVSQAAFVGIVGTAVGLLLSAAVLHYLNELRGLIAYVSGGGSVDTEALFLSTIPAQIDPLFITWTALGSILLCLLAAWPPAWLASRVDPAVALRD
ncbi:MAG: ABC transporter permease [Verrucomicrobiaceae bacterium]|nr:ABC transporter permease [Verrucomicrobiaceae bacterium]